MAVKPIPDGFHSVTPFLTVPGVAKLLDFLKQAFEAQELHRMPRPDGTIMHAEVRIGDSLVMMGVYKRALQAGATSTSEPADQFYGDRSAGIKDPVGNQWWIATHKEDVPLEEIARRAKAFMQ
jgi:PhnB protein